MCAGDSTHRKEPTVSHTAAQQQPPLICCPLSIPDNYSNKKEALLTFKADDDAVEDDSLILLASI